MVFVGNTLQNTMNHFSSKCYDKKKRESSAMDSSRDRLRSLSELLQKSGVHSANLMAASGFHYTGDGDKTRCDHCNLELSNWTSDTQPFAMHSKQRPDCPFVRSKTESRLSSVVSSTQTVVPNPVLFNEQENPYNPMEIELVGSPISVKTLPGTDLLQQIRKRTFSHWPQSLLPSAAQLIEAGFFNCNVGDRVICIYCNLMCEHWKSYTDEPCKVHKTRSPECPYFMTRSTRLAASPAEKTDMTSTNTSLTNLGPLRLNENFFTDACNPAYADETKRHATFATWPMENLPPVDDLIQAGFFYTGKKAIVTCFYCSGSLQNWGSNDNPTIEHARWFPYCLYAKQLCGDDLYRKIQESKRAQQERARVNDQKERASTGGVAATTSSTTNSRQWLIPDESTLSRLVSARLDLPISQRLLDQGYKLSIIKRCWEDQLRVKQDDFEQDSDLLIACLILQKQIENIRAKKRIPS